MSRINTNVSSLIAQTRLSRSNNQLQEALTRLSTGLRINSGKDDPAGLIASESLRSDITSVNKAITNTERANQVISTADAALGQISNLLNDIRGLVVEASNSGVLSQEQIGANQLQVDSSLEAIDRIAQVTTFQGRKLLDGSLDFLTNVTAGASSITDLTIQQANLGASGSVDVAVDITTAASRALVTNNSINYTAGTAATGTLTFSDTAAVQASASKSVTGGAFTISAVAGGLADGTVGNATSLVITNSAGLVNASGTVSLTGGSIDVAAVNGVASGAVGNATSIVLQSDSAIAQATGTLTLTTAGSFDVTTVANTTASGLNGIDITLQSGGSNGIASFNATTGALVVNVAAGATVSDIANAIGADARFNVSNITSGATVHTAPGDLTTYSNVTSGGNQGTTSAAYNATTNTITVNAAAQATITQIASAIDGLGDFSAAVNTGGSSVYDHTDNATLSSQLSSGANGAATSASYNSTTNTITVAAAGGATIAQISSVINGLADFNSAVTSGGTTTYSHADNGTTANALGSGGANATNNDVITFTSNSTGTAYNGTLSFARSSSVASGAVDVQTSGSNITITVNDNSAYDLEDLTDDIQSQLSGYTVALTGTAGNGTYSSATDVAGVATNLASGTADTGTGLGADLVFQLTGARGSQVFNFSAGTSLSQVISAINLVQDGTGVQATNNSGVLDLQSVEYGSEATVDIDVISEGSGGTFASSLSGTRDTGTDIVASVNGVQANGRGNNISLNTASLDLSLTVAAGSNTDINFSISGGGARFQLGPEVVTNQQARIGIGSVNTAKLGGVNGSLYELQSGNAKSLTNDATGAALIVDEVISKVTELRGRLGAFQRTTLETNIASLNDTLSNLTQAESSIRDADFAAESAKLTRAQILVQSGTTVLQIANQNPQQVLSLLRQ